MCADTSPVPNTAVGAREFADKYAKLIDELLASANGDRFGVSREIFTVALHASAMHRFGDISSDRQSVETYLRGLHLEDLALCCALRHRSEAAWEIFISSYRPLLYAAGRAIAGGRGEAYARELADSLWAELYGLDRKGDERRRSLLDYFHGRSKFATWLRTVLAQRHVDAVRASRQTFSLSGALTEQATEHGVPLPHQPPMATRAQTSATTDPDRTRLLPRLRQAVTEAIAAIAPSDRLLISLYYIEKLTLAQIARSRGMHEATVSRHLDRIRSDLREGIERSLAAGRARNNGDQTRKGLSPAEIQLCFAYALEDWPFDLSQALSTVGPPKKPDDLDPNQRKKTWPERSNVEEV